MSGYLWENASLECAHNHTPPCPDCDDSGYMPAGDLELGPADTTVDFCHCDTGEQMRRDYEADQVDREEDEREAGEISRI